MTADKSGDSGIAERSEAAIASGWSRRGNDASYPMTASPEEIREFKPGCQDTTAFQHRDYSADPVSRPGPRLADGS